MLTKIKQFVFYLGYELSLFQKVTAGLLAVAVVGFLGMQATNMVANISGELLKGSVTDGTVDAPQGTVLSITSVDQTSLATEGTLAVKYTLSNKPDVPFKFSLTVSTNEVEVGKGESESSEQSATVSAQIEASNRSAASYTVRITGEGGGQSLSDTVTVISGAPSTSSGTTLQPSPVPQPSPTPPAPIPTATPRTGSGTLPPGFDGSTRIIPVVPPVGSGTVLPPSTLQCAAIGRTCSLDTDCCNQRCAQVNVSNPKVMVCLPKR